MYAIAIVNRTLHVGVLLETYTRVSLHECKEYCWSKYRRPADFFGLMFANDESLHIVSRSVES